MSEKRRLGHPENGQRFVEEVQKYRIKIQQYIFY
jgi:hypothetical protein